MSTFSTIREWVVMKWRPRHPESLLQAYNATYSTAAGRLVLQDLLDNIYCTVYEGNDPNAALVHNARRTVVHEILENIDSARNPIKRSILVETGDGMAR